jgi:lipoprotein-anchoring transpeptidase ErfK/SrfK
MKTLIALALSAGVASFPPQQSSQLPAVPALPAAVTPASGEQELALQVLLDRDGFSPGEIDGRAGANTKKALDAFLQAKKLPPLTDAASILAALGGAAVETVVSYTITDEDAAGPFTRSIPADMMEKSKLKALHYTSLVEALGERFHASPALLRRLNPGARFAAGESVRVPNVGATPPPAPVAGAIVTVAKQLSVLTVTDATGAVLFHAPVTSGSEHDPLPIGEWTVTAISRNPTFNYNPDLFWDADPSHAKAKIPPGPNGPVGVVWIDLSKEHYGIHGAPEPNRIGYTSSHGCVRLTNWDAMKLAAMVSKGTRVVFKD